MKKNALLWMIILGPLVIQAQNKPEKQQELENDCIPEKTDSLVSLEGKQKNKKLRKNKPYKSKTAFRSISRGNKKSWSKRNKQHKKEHDPYYFTTKPTDK